MAQSLAAIFDRVLQSGDGRTPGTAYQVPSLMWEYEFLDFLDLRFRAQRTDAETGADVITGYDPETGQTEEVWFRAAIPAAPDQAQTDRALREIMTSGDGTTPETAFAVGGNIGAEYDILRFMGVRFGRQDLIRIGERSFDRLSGRDLDTGEERRVYFKLGYPGFD